MIGVFKNIRRVLCERHGYGGKVDTVWIGCDENGTWG
jgi:hypothetical protein